MAPPIYDPCDPGTPVPCGENPAFTYTRYPCDFDDPRPGNTRGLPTIIDLKTPVKAEVVNRQREAILAIEAELGIQPSGTFDTVRHRLDAMDSVLCSIWHTVGGNPISVKTNGTTLISTITSLNFIGSGVTVVDHDGHSGQADITIVASFDGYNTDGYVPIQEALPVVVNGQTWFTLTNIPFTNSLELFIEGIKQELGDFEVVGDRVHWTGIQALRTTDIVEVYYSKIYKIGYPGGVECCGTTMYQEPFTATPGQTEFQISRLALDLLSTELFISGVSQTVGTDYTLLDGYRIIYSGVPVLIGGETVVIKYFENLCLEAPESFTIYRQEVFSAINGQTDFVLAYLPINLYAAELFVDGVSMTVGVDYTLAGNVITYIPSIENPALTGGEVVVVKYLENESYVGAAGAIANLSQVLASGNDANNLNIINLNSLYALDGYFTNSVSIGGKLTVGGLIDPTGLVLESQGSNPTTPESGKATLWYRTSDGYVVISDLDKDIVLNGAGAGIGSGTLSEVLTSGDDAGGQNIVNLNELRVISIYNNGIIDGYNTSFNIIYGHNNSTANNYNTIIGYEAGKVNTADFNTFVGVMAGNNNTSGTANVFTGSGVGYSNTTGTHNVFTGNQAGFANTDGCHNVFAGDSAGFNNTTGGNNVFIGSYAGAYNGNGNFNTYVGYSTGDDVMFTNSTAIGANAQPTTSNQIVLGDNAVTEIISGGNNTTNLGSSSKYFQDGYITNLNCSIVKLDAQGSNPMTPESGKAILWYRASDGYVVISDAHKNIVLNTTKYVSEDTSAGETVTLPLVLSGQHSAGLYCVCPWVKVITPAGAGTLLAYVVTSDGEVISWAPQDITTAGVLFFPGVSVYSDGGTNIEIRFEVSGLIGTPDLQLKGSAV